MQTNHPKNPNMQAPLNRETIAQTLTRGKKVLFIAADRPVAAAFQQYRDYLDDIRVRTLSELDVKITPTDKPFIVFGHWDMIFAPPSYLHRQLVTQTD